ncbi:MAG TPA: phasin family protein [Acetobacteraceae bacterium]|jgi:phasin family protein|nr:phasin family protein [Acetobacteraceae bacterium]
MAFAMEAKGTGDAAKVAELKKAPGETAQAKAAYARMLVDESATGARVTMEKGMDQVNRAADNMFKTAEEFASFGRGNVEALAKSAQAYFAGVQDLSRQAASMMQGLTDQALESAKALSSARSLKEAAEIQAGIARTSFERAISETTKLQETALKVVEQAVAPLSARLTVAFEKFSRPLAV